MEDEPLVDDAPEEEDLPEPEVLPLLVLPLAPELDCPVPVEDCGV